VTNTAPTAHDSSIPRRFATTVHCEETAASQGDRRFAMGMCFAMGAGFAMGTRFAMGTGFTMGMCFAMGTGFTMGMCFAMGAGFAMGMCFAMGALRKTARTLASGAARARLVAMMYRGLLAFALIATAAGHAAADSQERTARPGPAETPAKVPGEEVAGGEVASGGAAGTDAREPPVPSVSAGRRAAAVAVAIVPGVLLRGAGSWIVGERRAAKRLAATGALGLAALVAGGAPIAATGSSPYTIWSGVPLVVGGTGLLVSSWMADIWVAAGGRRGVPRPRAAPPWSVDLATTWLHDAYRERALAGAAGHVDLGRLGLDGSGYLDAGGASRSGQVGARWRLLGPDASGLAIADGSRLVVRAAVRRDRDDDDRVGTTTAETELAGRLDLARLDPAALGSFLELSLGAGIVRTAYPMDRHDLDAILLAGFAWGAYLGDRGEVRLFYDHRRDGLAGGLAASRAAGFLGSVGASVELRVTGPWAACGQVQVGNAWVSTLGLRYLGAIAR
jgi:hypothetical protein